MARVVPGSRSVTRTEWHSFVVAVLAPGALVACASSSVLLPTLYILDCPTTRCVRDSSSRICRDEQRSSEPEDPGGVVLCGTGSLSRVRSEAFNNCRAIDAYVVRRAGNSEFICDN